MRKKSTPREFIEQLKRKSGVSNDEELGEIIGASKQTISYWKTGKVSLDLEKLLESFGEETIEYLKRSYGIGAADDENEVYLEAGKMLIDFMRKIMPISHPEVFTALRSKHNQEVLPFSDHSVTHSPRLTDIIDTALIVDNEPLIIPALKKSLSMHGFDVLSTTSADEAETIFDAAPGKVTLLISDIVMAGKNGVQLADALRARNPELKVILITGHTNKELRDRALEKNFTILDKPFTAKSFEAAVYAAYRNTDGTQEWHWDKVFH
ncbi:MAG: response regulator [Chlorobiaceae bacterium]